MANKLYIIVAGIILLGVAIFFGGYFSIVSDDNSYIIRDDFTTGLRSDLFVFTGNNIVENGWLKIPAILMCGGPGADYPRSYGAIDNKQYTTEDVEIRYHYIHSSDGNCPANYEPEINFNGQALSISNGAQMIYQNRNTGETQTEKTGIINIIHNNDLNVNSYDVYLDNSKVSSGVINNFATLKFSSGIEIDYVKYKPLFSCVFDKATEVKVQDKGFSQGSSFSIDDLSYIPIKFCPDDLGVLIIDSEQGLRTEKGSLSRELAYGNSLTVPAGQTYYPRYIAKYEVGMGIQCNEFTQEYSTELHKCIETGVIENKIIEIEKPQIITVTEQPNEISFVSSAFLQIAERQFEVSEIAFHKELVSCQVANGEYVSPTAYPECYEIDVEWGDFDFAIKNQETKKLNDYVSVTYNMDGSGVFKGEKNDINYDYEFLPNRYPKNNFKITFNNIFDVSVDGYLEKLKLNEKQELKLRLTNHLWDLTKAGYKYQVTKELINENLPYEIKTIPFIFGENRYGLILPTDAFGTYKVYAIPYFMMDNNKEYISNQHILLGYLVTNDPETLNCNTGLECSIGQCQTDGTCLVTEEKIITQTETQTQTVEVIKTIEKVPIWVWFTIGIFVIAIIVMIVILRRK